MQEQKSEIESGSPFQHTLVSRFLVVWLFLAFCGTLYLNFSKPSQAQEGEVQIVRLAERMAVVAQYTRDMQPEIKRELLKTALSLETDEQAKSIISGTLPDSLDLDTLSPVYRLLAEDLLGANPQASEELQRLATEGRQRFLLSLSLLSSLGLFAIVTFFLPSIADSEPPETTDLDGFTVLGVFFAWHVFGFIGVGLFVGLMSSSVDEFFMILLAQGLTYLWMLALLSQARLRRNSSPFRAFSWSWIGKGYALSILAVVGVNSVISALSGEAPRSENPILGLFVDAPGWKYVMLGLLVVVVGPIFEEIMFRGWLFGGLRKGWGDQAAYLLSATLFALIHGDAPALPALFLLGLIFAWVYRRSGSLYTSILVHGMWNATTFSLLLSVMP